MGTQQMLLLILSAIIVAVAISIGVVYFKSHQQEADINEVINELNHIAASAQAWYRKPLSFSGGDGSFTNFDFKVIGEPDSTSLARYEVVSAVAKELQLKAVGYQSFTVSVNVYPDSIGPYTVVR